MKLQQTGLVLHEKDYRSLLFGNVLPFIKLPTNHVTKKLPVDYQSRVPKCVAEAYSYLARKQDLKETGKDFKLSADALYSYIKNYLDKDRHWGTSLIQGGKAITRFGIPEEMFFPDDEAYWNNKDDYFDVKRFTTAVMKNAEVHSKKLYIRGSGIGWGLSNSEEIKQMIFQREASVIAVRYDENWHRGVRYPKPPISPRVNHAICADSWRYGNRGLEFRIANSLEPDPAKRLLENGKAFAWLLWDWWKPHVWGNYTTVDKPNIYPETYMLKLVRDRADTINGKVYAIINGRRKWLIEPKELEDWQIAKLVGENKDIKNISREELEKYPLVKMSFKQFVAHYFDK